MASDDSLRLLTGIFIFLFCILFDFIFNKLIFLDPLIESPLTGLEARAAVGGKLLLDLHKVSEMLLKVWKRSIEIEKRENCRIKMTLMKNQLIEPS